MDDAEFDEVPPTDGNDGAGAVESEAMIEPESTVDLDETDDADVTGDGIEVEPGDLVEELAPEMPEDSRRSETRAAVPWTGRQGNQVDLGIGRPGYFVAPVVERGHAVVVLSDMGDHLAEHVLDAADRIASLGDSALAVDLFTDDSGPSDLDPDTVVRLVATAIDTLIAGGFAASGTVGLVGFGVGGSLAMWIAGLEERVTSVAAFGPHSPWAEVGVGWRLSEAAYLCHQSSSVQPPGAPDAAKTEIELRDLGLDATFHVYPVDPVDFYKSGTSGYDARLSDLAWQRTELFLERHL